MMAVGQNQRSRDAMSVSTPGASLQARAGRMNGVMKRPSMAPARCSCACCLLLASAAHRHFACVGPLLGPATGSPRQMPYSRCSKPELSKGVNQDDQRENLQGRVDAAYFSSMHL